MPNDASASPPAPPVRSWHPGRGAMLQIVLAAVLLAAVNYAGFHYYGRWDWSRSQKYQLSDMTRRVLRDLPDKATVYVVFSPTGSGPGYEIFGDVTNLLKEYQLAQRDKVHVEFVDPMRNPTRARELQARLQFDGEENLLVVETAGRTKFLTVTDLADYDFSRMMAGEPPRVAAFKGEQALTGALVELGSEKPRTVYFLQGQGEAAVGEGSPLQLLLGYVARLGVRIEPLNLALTPAVPSEAGAVVVAGPAYDLPGPVVEALARYWEAQGRLVVLLDPEASTPRLHGLLAAAGIRPRDDRVLRTVPLGTLTGILRDVTGVFVPDNRITRRLQGANATFLGGTQSLALSAEGKPGLTVEPLIEAAEGFWGETRHVTDEQTGVAFDEGEDTGAPVVLAAMAEKGGVAEDTVAVSSSRMVVVGNSRFVQEDALTGPDLDFFLSSLGWLLDRQQLIGVAPKTVRAFTLSLSDEQMASISLYTMVVMPGTAALVGLLVAWRRRR